MVLLFSEEEIFYPNEILRFIIRDEACKLKKKLILYVVIVSFKIESNIEVVGE